MSALQRQHQRHLRALRRTPRCAKSATIKRDGVVFDGMLVPWHVAPDVDCETLWAGTEDRPGLHKVTLGVFVEGRVSRL